ncbi:hypothetical protein WEI85_18455 [Actinomycetes bacterium KLBMP 9797]
MNTEPASARAEAERLVAAALAAFSTGHGLFGGGPIATGEPACCVCPICRVIAAMRDPDADVAERLATGAGDFAAGVASLLRSLAPPPPPAPSDSPPAPSDSPEDDVWRAATRAE